MSPTNLIGQSKEGICPHCHHSLTFISPAHFLCKKCKQEFIEEIRCPKCNDLLNAISGCGSTNYLCKKDGLISSKQIIYYYIKN